MKLISHAQFLLCISLENSENGIKEVTTDWGAMWTFVITIISAFLTFKVL